MLVNSKFSSSNMLRKLTKFMAYIKKIPAKVMRMNKHEQHEGESAGNTLTEHFYVGTKSKISIFAVSKNKLTKLTIHTKKKNLFTNVR